MRNLVMGALLVCSVVLCGAAAGEEPKNLIKNPGFEIAVPDKDQPQDWRVVIWSSGKDKTGKAAAELTDDAHGGKKAVKIRHFEGSRNILLAGTLSEPITGAHRFRLTFYAKVPRGLAAYSSVYVTDAKGNKLAFLIGKATTPSVAWQEVLFEFATPADTTSVSIYLRANGDGVLFDDVRLEPLAEE